ncbi:unnamed protein product [Vitrella brassicaformis CCMP3155]|uniref:Uncharacterized protein n=1 Tax=Vitrella brassicaformis (strain CCMP3155) TaxID=1169540 RepID=A0A0G4ENB9_VITBC|nr:unnamed protein product [Vitrella brassicaformis CCMP3155]|eukprot:CEL98492.1 unnamed protein product [Vitrella brassicaformis CCMP3155]
MMRGVRAFKSAASDKEAKSEKKLVAFSKEEGTEATKEGRAASMLKKAISKTSGEESAVSASSAAETSESSDSQEADAGKVETQKDMSPTERLGRLYSVHASAISQEGRTFSQAGTDVQRLLRGAAAFRAAGKRRATAPSAPPQADEDQSREAASAKASSAFPKKGLPQGIASRLRLKAKSAAQSGKEGGEISEVASSSSSSEVKAEDFEKQEGVTTTERMAE